MAHTQSSPNTSNYEFSTNPRVSYASPFPVRFYLNHFRSSTVDYVLDETGWNSITQYEDKARHYDMFTCFVAPNGFLQSTYPQVDSECFRVFEFSLHHLRRDVLERLMYYYIGMNQTDYELQYPEYNTIYVAIPYYSWVCSGTVRDWSKCPQPTTNDVEPQVSKTQVEYESDSDTYETDEDDEPMVNAKPVLAGWKFKLNSETKNSYILQPPSAVTKVSGGLVYWGKSWDSTPTTWKLVCPGLDRPVYYNAKYGGWIVSLKLAQSLVQLGASKL
jgi:hypothetical protein